jgi:hypothetical protein
MIGPLEIGYFEGANLLEGHEYAHHAGRSFPRLRRRRNTCRRRRYVPKCASARSDQRHASGSQPPTCAEGNERAALRPIGVVFAQRPPRLVSGRAGDPETAGHERCQQTVSRRYKCHDAPRCTALHTRRHREIGGATQTKPATGDTPRRAPRHRSAVNPGPPSSVPPKERGWDFS